MKKCSNGHLFDEKEHDVCPVCNKNSEVRFNASRNVSVCVYGPPRHNPDMKINMKKKPQKRRSIFDKLFKRK